MSMAPKQVYINSSFRLDSEYEEMKTEYHKYYEINSVQTEEPSIDVQNALPNTAPRRANTRVCLIIMFVLIAIALTGVTTFFITKETLPKTQFPDAETSSCYWSSWSSWSKCNNTCGNGTQVRLKLHMNITRLCSHNESYDSKTCRSVCAGHATTTPTASTESGSISDACPSSSHLTSRCVEQCSSDSECYVQDKCCYNGCGHTCRKSVTFVDPALQTGKEIGIWSFWSQWSDCAVRCSNGERVRNRQCTGTCSGTNSEIQTCSINCPADRRRFKRSKRSVRPLPNNCHGQAPKVVYGIETGKSCNNLMICGDIARVDGKTVFADCCNVHITSPLVYMCICCPWVTAINPRQTELCTCTKMAMG